MSGPNASSLPPRLMTARSTAGSKSTSISSLSWSKMALVRLCSCKEYNGRHSSIGTKETELRESIGVTISYTWGEFDRQGHHIGHVHSSSSSAVSLRLGAEWLVDGFIEWLSERTAEFGAYWIDSFCNPQSDEAIRKTLLAIPTIYKTLDVFVIIPDPICSCLPTAYRAFEAAKQALDDPLSTTAEVETLYKAALKNPSTAVEADVHRP